MFSARRSEHTTPLLRELHWLKVLERVQFRLCVLVYRCLKGTAPSYLAETLRQSADVEQLRRLRSAATPTLIVPSTRRVTLGDRHRPCLPGGSCTRLECLNASVCQGCFIAGTVPPGSEDSVFHGVIWLSRLTMSFADCDCLL